MSDRIKPTINDGPTGAFSSAKPLADGEASERNRAETFLALHVQNHSRLSAFVHMLVPAWQDAEEIVQDTLVVLWRKFDEFDTGTSFFSWAARVAQYEVLNYRRKNRQRVLLLDEAILEAVGRRSRCSVHDPDHVLHREHPVERCYRNP
jgi:RNA polymerase sigma factor (sigma-70 family)